MTMRFALIILMASLAGCGSSASPGDQSLMAQANALHRTLAPALANDPPLRAYLQQVAGRMMAAAREVMKERFPGSGGDEWMFSRDMQFDVGLCGVPNAFTTGGQHVYVLAG